MSAAAQTGSGDKVRVLILGKGGREHALAQAIARSPLLDKLWICPGNPGMTLCGFPCVADDDVDAVLRFCARQHVNVVIPGAEAYIVSDLKERLQSAGVFCFSPTQELAQLESSKQYAKDVLHAAGLPTPRAMRINNQAEGANALAAHDFKSNGVVLKADGLAAGKGVVVCATRTDAEAALHALAADYGFPLLLEEQIHGPELSAFALCHGTSCRVLGTACDYKRITPDPYSANTGGMGAYSPCDFIGAEDHAQIRRIFERTLQTLTTRGLHYEGFLFAGLMKTATGLQVLEFNVRLGDPEAQVLLPRLQEDLLSLIMQAHAGTLPVGLAAISADCAVHVVAASRGYPCKDMLLHQPITLPDTQDGVIFAGVATGASGLVNNGGRVLGATALGPTRAVARERAYARLATLSFPGMTIRTDIAA